MQCPSHWCSTVKVFKDVWFQQPWLYSHNIWMQSFTSNYLCKLRINWIYFQLEIKSPCQIYDSFFLIMGKIFVMVSEFACSLISMFVPLSSLLWKPIEVKTFRGQGGSMSQVVGLPNNLYKPITNMAWVCAGFVNYKKGALDSQLQVIKFTSCLPMVGGSLQVLRLLPPLKLVAMIQLKYC